MADSASVTSTVTASALNTPRGKHDPNKPDYEVQTHSGVPKEKKKVVNYAVGTTVGHRETFGDNLRLSAGYPRIFFQTTTQVTIELMVERPAAVICQCVEVPDSARKHDAYQYADASFEKSQTVTIRTLTRERDLLIQRLRKKMEKPGLDDAQDSDEDEEVLKRDVTDTGREKPYVKPIRFEANLHGSHARPKFYEQFHFATPMLVRFHAGHVPKTLPLVGLKADGQYEFYATVIDDSLVPFYRKMVNETILASWMVLTAWEVDMASGTNKKNQKQSEGLVSKAGHQRISNIKKACTETSTKFPFAADQRYPSHPLHTELSSLPQPWNLEMMSESLHFYVKHGRDLSPASKAKNKDADDDLPPGFFSRKGVDPEQLTTLVSFARLRFETLSKHPKFLDISFVPNGVRFRLDRPNCMVYWVPVNPARDEMAQRVRAQNATGGVLANKSASSSTSALVPPTASSVAAKKMNQTHLNEHDFSNTGMARTRRNDELDSLISSPGGRSDKNVFDELLEQDEEEKDRAAAADDAENAKSTANKEDAGSQATSPSAVSSSPAAPSAPAAPAPVPYKALDPRLKPYALAAAGDLAGTGAPDSDDEFAVNKSPKEQAPDQHFEASLIVRDRAIAAGHYLNVTGEKGFITLPPAFQGRPLDFVAETIPDTTRAKSAVEVQRLGPGRDNLKDVKIRKMFDPLFSSLRPRSMMPKPYRLFYQQPQVPEEELEATISSPLRTRTSSGGVGGGPAAAPGAAASKLSPFSTSSPFGSRRATRNSISVSGAGPAAADKNTTPAGKFIDRKDAKGYLDTPQSAYAPGAAVHFEKTPQNLQRFALRRTDIVSGTPDAELVQTFGPDVVPEVFPYSRKLVSVSESLKTSYGRPPEHIKMQSSLDVELQEPRPFVPQHTVITDENRYENDGEDPNAVKKAKPYYYQQLQRTASTDLTYPINVFQDLDGAKFYLRGDKKERKNEVNWSAFDAAIEWNQDTRLNVFQQNLWRPITFPWYRAGVDERGLRVRVAFSLSVPTKKAERAASWEIKLVAAGGGAAAQAVSNEGPPDPDADPFAGLLLFLKVSDVDKKIVVNDEEYGGDEIKQLVDGDRGYQIFFRYSSSERETWDIVFHSPGIPLFTVRTPVLGSGPEPAVLDYITCSVSTGVSAFLTPYTLPLFYEAFDSGGALMLAHGKGTLSSAKDLTRRRKIMSELSKKVRTKDEEYLFITCRVCGWKQRQNLSQDIQRCKRCGKSNPTTYPSIVRVMERMRENNDPDAEDFVHYCENQAPPQDTRSWPTRKFQSTNDHKAGKKKADFDVALLGFQE
ncbi:unnamed protein product [Amoebophrya sp. A120]|nr:unnamed protein product [Amoebophrya sp. A120]|eukprot:GSA120T00004866001.1